MKYKYTNEGDRLNRRLIIDDIVETVSYIPCPGEHSASINISQDEYDLQWLRTKTPPFSSEKNGTIRAIDLFCGCGGLSLGIAEACRALEYKFQVVLGADLDKTALGVYIDNFAPLFTIDDPIETVIDSELNEPLSDNEKAFVEKVGKIDLLMGGPPCQGNSDLNNHTRRNDPRNLLYLRMIRCAQILKPKFVLIENVPGVQHDTHGVVSVAKEELESLGYFVDSKTIDMSDIGVPQKRKRFFLVASMLNGISIEEALDNNHTDIRSLGWAIEDLLEDVTGDTFNTPANSSTTNKKRIDYLFDHDIYDLPNEQRPDCHRLKKHSYTSVYGRMYWELPAQTITGGFGSNGQGRFVHPRKRRTITPHEAARLQFFPDYFRFQNVKRRELQQIIGNAVPSKCSYVLGITLLSEYLRKAERIIS